MSGVVPPLIVCHSQYTEDSTFRFYRFSFFMIAV